MVWQFPYRRDLGRIVTLHEVEEADARSLSRLVAAPMLYEVPMGESLHSILYAEVFPNQLNK